jgi:hypothetical protein
MARPWNPRLPPLIRSRHPSRSPITTASGSSGTILERRQDISPTSSLNGAAAATELVLPDATDLLCLANTLLKARQVNVQPTSPTGVPTVTVTKAAATVTETAATATGLPDGPDP